MQHLCLEFPVIRVGLSLRAAQRLLRNVASGHVGGDLEGAACVSARITGGGSRVLPADIPMQFKD